MFRRREEISDEALAALRQDLLRAPVRGASPGFDARVHAALSQPEPTRLQAFWMAVRPALSAAAFSLLLTLALLKGMSMTAATPVGPAGARPVVAYGQMASVGGIGDFR